MLRTALLIAHAGCGGRGAPETVEDRRAGLAGTWAIRNDGIEVVAGRGFRHRVELGDQVPHVPQDSARPAVGWWVRRGRLGPPPSGR